MEKDPSNREDLEKVREFLSGDSRAFEFLFDKYRGKVYAVAYRFVRNKEDALEIAQEVFLRAYQGLPRFKTDSKFFTWLYRITVNRSIDTVPSKKTRPVLESSRGEPEGRDLLDGIANPRSHDPARLAEQKEMGDRIFQAVSQLSPNHQTVFLLHAVEQLSYREIAEVVGCSIGTVMSRLFYARKKLQSYLVQYG